MSAFGAKLQLLRLERGLSKKDLAEIAGLSAQAISHLESGRRANPYASTVQALARALYVAPSCLLDGETK
jgi:transcriptional regulator with XRE-family HTH domain